jgi:ribonuclease HI
MKLEAFFDGSCGPVNPGGTATWGFIIYSYGECIKTGRGIVGTGPGMTNNVAEASGLYSLMECILSEFEDASEVHIKGDSNIVIRQMNGKNKKAARGHYVPYLKKAHDLADILRHRCLVNFEWIPRGMNVEADALADFRGEFEYEDLGGFVKTDQEFAMRLERES